MEAKKAVPKEDHPSAKQANGLSSQRTKKIFVGGLAPSVDEQAFRKYFEQYGPVEDAVVMWVSDSQLLSGTESDKFEMRTVIHGRKFV